MNDIEYWTERALLQEQRMRDKSDKVLSNLQKEYQAARRNLQKQMESWYQKYSGEFGVSVAQARKKLTAKESKRHQESIEDFIAKAQTGDSRFDEELRRRYMRSRVSRLQSLQDQVAVQLALLGKSQDVQTFKLLQETCQDTYYHALYNAARRIGINSRFDRFNERVVERICRTPWSGKSFSERIWQNNDKLIKEVRHILSQGAIQGSSIEKMSRQLAARMGVDYRRAECLIRTESNFVQGQATAEAYRQMGIERYQYLATLDARTSQICRRLDNEVFTLKEKAIGVNYPPMHPRCRSTTIPYYGDEFTEDETRAARGSDGKTTRIKADVTYAQWQEVFVVPETSALSSGMQIYTIIELEALTKEINLLLDQYLSTPSKWSGHIVPPVGGHFYGKLWSCDIVSRNISAPHILLHESLHARSCSYYDEPTYIRFKKSEEAAVQLLAEELSKAHNIPLIVSGYADLVEYLRHINQIAQIADNELDFALMLFKQPMPERLDWLEEKIGAIMANGGTIGEYQDAMALLKKLEGTI